MAANCSSLSLAQPFVPSRPLPARMRVTYLSEAAKARERRKKERKLSIRPSADETERGGRVEEKVEKSPTKICGRNLGARRQERRRRRLEKPKLWQKLPCERDAKVFAGGDGVFYGTRLATA